MWKQASLWQREEVNLDVFVNEELEAFLEAFPDGASEDQVDEWLRVQEELV